MKARLKYYLSVILLAYVIVLGVNITNNYQYYKTTGDWQYSVTFCLVATTLGCAGAISLYNLFLRRMKWPVRPIASLLSVVVVSGLYGIVLMYCVVNIMSLIFFHTAPGFSHYIPETTYSVLFCIIFGLMGSGLEYLNQWRRSAEENARSQYEILKGQVNPHFFFNSLNTLTVLIPQNSSLAVDFVQHLSKVFRYSLQHAEDNTVALETELKIADSYLFLNRQRFGDKLQVRIDIPADTKQKHIVTQSLLMLLENAIKHNEISIENPLNLRVYVEDDMLVVENSCRKKNTPEESTGIGLLNITNRYRLISNTPVVVTANADKYIVRIPLLRK